jgi:pimeloyl-ACP methyl ester carboxylesterase
MRKYLKWIPVILLVLFAIVAVYPFVAGDMETLVLDDAARASMPDKSFVRLSDGYTHYEWGGPENGPTVVLVHGAATPSFIWDYQFGALAEAGFHVLRYDLFGRGLSDRTRVHTADLFDRQLLELLDSQKIKAPADVVGVSMGGAITVRFIDRHPDRVRRFALFAPAGFTGGQHVPLSSRVVRWPLVGEWLMKSIGDRMITATMSRQVRNPDKSREFMQKWMQQRKYKGFKQTMLSLLRDSSFVNLKPVYERVGKSGKSGILFMGTNDHQVPFAHHALFQAAIPSIEFHAIEGGDHSMIHELPDAVNPLLIEFLKR